MTIFSLRSMTKFALVAALAGSATGCVVRAHGGLRVRMPFVYIQEAPPPPPPQPAVVRRPGFLWVDGYHRWDGHRYQWQDGHYERERAGYSWAPGRWEHRDRGHVWVDGEWRRGDHDNGRDHDRDDRPKVRDHRKGH